MNTQISSAVEALKRVSRFHLDESKRFAKMAESCTNGAAPRRRSRTTTRRVASRRRPTTRRLSAAGRANIQKAQRARWAALRASKRKVAAKRVAKASKKE